MNVFTRRLKNKSSAMRYVSNHSTVAGLRISPVKKIGRMELLLGQCAFGVNWKHFSTLHMLQSWPIVKIAIISNSLEGSLAISKAIVPKIVNSNSNSIAIVQFLLLKFALQGVFV